MKKDTSRKKHSGLYNVTYIALHKKQVLEYTCCGVNIFNKSYYTNLCQKYSRIINLISPKQSDPVKRPT